MPIRGGVEAKGIVKGCPRELTKSPADDHTGYGAGRKVT
jgi:hypothetical protein